jgi:KH domain
VTVSGPSPDLVQQAVTQINGLISEASGPSAGDMSENVECPPGIVGRIIGRGGETIRGLQQASGAHIVVNQVSSTLHRIFQGFVGQRRPQLSTRSFYLFEGELNCHSQDNK